MLFFSTSCDALFFISAIFILFFSLWRYKNAAPVIARRSEEFILVLGTAKESNEVILHCIVSICDGTSRQRSIALQTWFAKYFIETIKCQLVVCSVFVHLFLLNLFSMILLVQFYRKASSSRRWLINALGPLIALRDNANLLLYAQMSWRCCCRSFFHSLCARFCCCCLCVPISLEHGKIMEWKASWNRVWTRSD